MTLPSVRKVFWLISCALEETYTHFTVEVSSTVLQKQCSVVSWRKSPHSPILGYGDFFWSKEKERFPQLFTFFCRPKEETCTPIEEYCFKPWWSHLGCATLLIRSITNIAYQNYVSCVLRIGYPRRLTVAL